ncbi:MAG TPA: response regulator [Polyangiaceae bacterium]|jgi:two-component system cell cycle sensor histidine kinase/response regulator CckA|nr:response regulator [Polyangiaceae bacterium]
MSDDATRQGLGTEPAPSSEVLKFVLEHAPVRVFEVDAQGVFIMNDGVNPSEGSAPGTLVGVNARQAYSGFPEGLQALEQALAGTESGVRFARAGRTYDLVLSPRRNERGEVVSVLGMAQVVTERVRAEEEARKSEERFRRVFESNMLGLTFVRATGEIIEANDSMLSTLGYTREDLEQGLVNWRSATVPGHEPADDRALAEMSASGVCTPYEKELFRKDGSKVPVLIGGATLYEAEGMGVAFMLDLSERKHNQEERERFQAQLLQVQKLESLGVLAGGIAHDFNNLLTAILGSASAAMLTLANESPARPDLDNVVLASRRAANLTRQLLAYSGKGHFEVRPIDLSVHVRELATLLETTISKKVQLRLELTHDMPPVSADIAQVQQIVMNLVINGAEAIGDQRGTVLVTTGVQNIDEFYVQSLFPSEGIDPGNYVYLEVHDTGCGMDEATKVRIFDPFFTTKFTGRGLGLAAVMGIVRGHKGAIKVYSSPAKGTTFKVFFPAAEGSAVRPAPEVMSFRGEGVALVVDDDQGVREAASRLLEFFGFRVLQAVDGRHGTEVFRQHHGEIVVVILDMTMPEMNGEETFREIRRVRSDVPVILTSGYNEIEATRRFTAKGLAGFLQKPFTPKELTRKLAVALKIGGHAASE